MELVKAFIIGGLICVVGQLLMDLTSYKITQAHILVGFVVLGAILGGVGVYQPLVEFAGAGASVPLTGFGNTLVQGVFKGVGEDGLLGVFSGGLTATAIGISTAIIFSYAVALICRPHG